MFLRWYASPAHEVPDNIFIGAEEVLFTRIVLRKRSVVVRSGILRPLIVIPFCVRCHCNGSDVLIRASVADKTGKQCILLFSPSPQGFFQFHCFGSLQRQDLAKCTEFLDWPGLLDRLLVELEDIQIYGLEKVWFHLGDCRRRLCVFRDVCFDSVASCGHTWIVVNGCWQE